MSFEFYKILHLIGLFLLLSGLMGMLFLKISKINLEGALKRLLFMSHGLGLLLILVSGFGQMARLGLVSEIPHWIYIKLLIWAYFGAAVVLIKKKGDTMGRALYGAFITIFAVAAVIAILKPQF